MKLKNILRKASFLFIFSLFFSQNSFAQCFQIESILVDACEASPMTEGWNEMVRFKVGPTAVNTNVIDVDWPSNNWFGLVQNTTTTTKVANINANILAAGGCGQVLQPTNGVLPANATVLLITSYNFNITANSFGALNDTIYIIFQNSTVTGGHFGNYGNSGNNFRTLKISFGSCSDTVTYNRSLLVDQAGQNIAADGATVVFTPSGVASYINNGCIAPIDPFTVNAGPPTTNVCAGNPVNLTGTAQGHQSVLWSAPSGTFSNPTSLTTTFTPTFPSAGTVVPVTLTATNSCGATITDIINVTVNNATTPSFNVIPVTICTGGSVPPLNTTSPNGISGTWSPAVISNTASGTYTFTPNAGQCATPVTLNVTITNSITPDFDVTPVTFCTGSAVPTLATTSPNGIAGTWAPTVVSNTASGTYTFTPNAGQCATPVTLSVSITNSITPDFNVTPVTVCDGGSVPTLATTSPNGISGTWAPAVVSNTASGTYTFTPNAGQCGTSVTLSVTITNAVTPDFATTLAYCSTDIIPALATTSPNGISGTWSPAVISNTASGTYTFTPNAGQCATPVTLNVTITNSITPDFDVTPVTFCTGSAVPTLATTSPNGISGTWAPAVVSNTASGTYTFTPNAGQCATPVTLSVTITNSTIPDFVTTLSFCNGETVPTLNTTSPNGVSGTWSPATISNTASGTYTFTPNAGQCGTSVTLSVTITNAVTPDFATTLAYCSTDTIPALAMTSPNGISGTWSPAVISNTASGTYTFTPNAGQCATPVTLNVTITNSITPDFDVTPVTFCTGSAVPTLATTSPNGIAGTWAPTVVSNTASGTYTFTPNAGQCATPVTLSVSITNSITPDFNVTPVTVCDGGSVPTLATTSPNGISGTWAPAVVSNTASGTYTFTPNAGQCGTSVTLSVTITNAVTPDFATTLAYCSTDIIPALATTSPNGISGTWSPAVISNTASGTYTFTPNAGQCATPVTLNVTITNSITPDFDVTPVTFCTGSAVPTLATTSPNGISGTWAPAVVSNTASGTYTFTPNAGQCATPVTLSVTITNSTIPDFVTTLSFCNGETVPTLNTTSPNGVSGTWSPATISNTASGTYTFTPNAGQCGTSVTLSVTITNAVTPDFATTLAYCSTDTIPALAMTSPNGISGTWSPAVISNTASGTYTFTPNAGQCATPVILSVTITNSITPDFDVTPITLCTGSAVPTLATTSPNGIAGTWAPAVVSNTTSGNYVFTPNAGQCASSVTLSVSITNSITPDFNVTPVTVCNGGSVPTLATTSPNGISGTWAPAVVSNTASGTYTFTPNAGQCGTSVTLSVTITNAVTPDFATTLAYCSTDIIPALATTSPNGISGTWSPAVISNTASGTYTFTPNAGQCATPVTLNVTITNSITPDFDVTPVTFCTGSAVPTLATTSPNGISGTWAPAVVSNTASGTYTFTPNAGQCATPVTLSVTITNSTIPDFVTTLSFCNGETVPTLNTTSPNGISGTWSPATISNTASGNYIFTPNAGQCASSITLAVTINTVSIATIEGPDSVCVNSAIVLTNTTPNGSWTSSNTAIATIDTNGNVTGISPGNAIITYSLNNSACGSVTKTIRVNALPNPVLNDAFLCVDNQTGLVISSVNLHSGLSNSNFSFVWTLNNTVLPTTTNAHQATEPGVYNVTATNVLTGCEASATATVGTSSMGIAEATVGRDFDRNQTITVTVTGGSGNYTYQLDNGIPQTSNIFTNIREGEYEITVRDAGGCGETTLSVYALNYPYYFTPNGDGYHDTWNIKGLSDQPNAVIYIFDRYGKLLKQLKPSPSSGWDGTYNGHALPSTDYWFKLLYQSRDGSQKEFKAHFAMKR